MLSVFRRSACYISPKLRKGVFPPLQPITVRTFARASDKAEQEPNNSKSKPDEPIIVEIIDNTEKFKEKNEYANRRAEKAVAKPAFSLFGFVQDTAKSVVGTISNTFFPDEDTKLKNEMKHKVNAKIDAAFQGGGLLQGVLKHAAKVVSGRMVTKMVEIERAQEKLFNDVDGILGRDPLTKQHLGYPVQLSAMISANTSIVDDGRGPQGVQLVTYQVVGKQADGYVTVTVDPFAGKDWNITKIQVQVDSGKVYDVKLTARPDKAHIIDL